MLLLFGVAFVFFGRFFYGPANAWTSCITLWTGCFAVYFGVALPQFVAVFRGFGADLPSLTECVIRNGMLVWAWLLLIFIGQLGLLVFFFVSGTHQARRAVSLSSKVNGLHQLVLIGAMYAPIFKLGAVV